MFSLLMFFYFQIWTQSKHRGVSIHSGKENLYQTFYVTEEKKVKNDPGTTQIPGSESATLVVYTLNSSSIKRNFDLIWVLRLNSDLTHRKNRIRIRPKFSKLQLCYTHGTQNMLRTHERKKISDL